MVSLLFVRDASRHWHRVTEPNARIGGVKPAYGTACQRLILRGMPESKDAPPVEADVCRTCADYDEAAPLAAARPARARLR